MAFHLAKVLSLDCLLGLANRAPLEAMDQSFPPRPALFLGLMLILEPSSLRQFLSKLWVTYPMLQPPWLLNSMPLVATMPARREPMSNTFLVGPRRNCTRTVPYEREARTDALVRAACLNHAASLANRTIAAITPALKIPPRRVDLALATPSDNPACKVK